MNEKELARIVYELSKQNNTDDDDFFYIIEEIGEIFTAYSHHRRGRNVKTNLSREFCQAIIQIEKMAYRLGIFDDVKDLYSQELLILKHKIERN